MHLWVRSVTAGASLTAGQDGTGMESHNASLGVSDVERCIYARACSNRFGLDELQAGAAEAGIARVDD
jgi:hypothetical protein